MSGSGYAILLGGVVVWPLLLALPTLHSRLPWPLFLAIAPAALLILLPGEANLPLPWLALGTTHLSVDGSNRWILAMLVTLWLIAIPPRSRAPHPPLYHLLTLAGALGAVLATDLIGFFLFSTLMGYSFYGVLLQSGGQATRYAGRFYLIALVIADLILFEAILLAGLTTDALQFGGVHQTMTNSDEATLFATLVATGFMLKLGVWPVHGWLSASLANATRSTTTLLCGIPIAMALLGAVRWLPLGHSSFYTLGTTLQLWGGIVLIFAIWKSKHLPTSAALLITGTFLALLGGALAYPELWREHGHLAPPLIALSGILLASTIFGLGHFKKADQPSNQRDLLMWAVEKTGALPPPYCQRLGQIFRQPIAIKLIEQIRHWGDLLNTAERWLRNWSLIITVLLIFGVIVVLGR